MAETGGSSDSHQIIIDPIEEHLSPCDWSSFSYFLLSFLLFTVGSILTFLSIDDTGTQNPFTRFWLIGPLFLCSGLVMATKTLIYLKSKNLIELLTRQSEFCISANNANIFNAPHDVVTDAYVSSLPPPYEAAVANSNHSIYITIMQPSSVPASASTSRPPSCLSQTPRPISAMSANGIADIRSASPSAILVRGSSKTLNREPSVEQPPPPYEMAVK